MSLPVRRARSTTRWLCVVTCLFFTASLLVVLATRMIGADVPERGLGLGLSHQMAKLEALSTGAHIVRVNGAEVRRSSAFTDRPVSEVVGRYAAYCRETPSLMDEAMKDIPRAIEHPLVAARADSARGAVLRWDMGDTGMVICLVGDRSALITGDDFQKRLEAFASAGDLAELGRVRVVFADRGTKGGRTHVVALWSVDPIDLSTLFPASGDAPGDDSSVVPRPPSSRRTLSVSTDNLPGAARSYETAASVDEVTASYDREMRARGFRKLATPVADLYRRADGVEVIVRLSRKGATTTVTIVEADMGQVHAPTQRTSS